MCLVIISKNIFFLLGIFFIFNWFSIDFKILLQFFFFIEKKLRNVLRYYFLLFNI